MYEYFFCVSSDIEGEESLKFEHKMQDTRCVEHTAVYSDDITTYHLDACTN